MSKNLQSYDVPEGIVIIDTDGDRELYHLVTKSDTGIQTARISAEKAFRFVRRK